MEEGVNEVRHFLDVFYVTEWINASSC